ncbi:hypothetical protein DIURU_003643 [Diutina rugosa]|uniref:Opaque-phase-specific protein OP4 n=1 Tax=Diutina rugosa TaxID=5481 RepID=A0A642ULU7_DIURU|nr:uncharacterized protein DIURU_003643 [Diutina rugosa]KAA8901273.1 hypothetical protein DIURU_003643 [Diutina rugosa]
MKLHTAYGILVAVACCAAEGGAAPNPAKGLAHFSSSLVTREQSDEVMKSLNQIAALTKQKRDESDVDFAKRADTDLGNLIIAILNSGWVGQVIDTISNDPELKGVISTIAKGIVDAVVGNLWPLLKAIWNSGLIGKTIKTFLNDSQVTSALLKIVGDVVSLIFKWIVGLFTGGSSSSGTSTASTAAAPANPGATTTTVRAAPPAATGAPANASTSTGGNFLDELFGGGNGATTTTRTTTPLGTAQTTGTGGNFLDGLFGGAGSGAATTTTAQGTGGNFLDGLFGGGSSASHSTQNAAAAPTVSNNNAVLNSLYGAYGTDGGVAVATGPATVAVSAGAAGAQLSVAAPGITAAATVDNSDPQVNNDPAVLSSLAAAYGQHKRAAAPEAEYLTEREVQDNVDAVVAQLKQSGLVEQFLKKLTSDPNQASDFLSQVLAKSIVSLDELYGWAKDNGLVDSMLSSLQSSGNQYAQSLGNYLQKNGGSLEGAISQLSAQLGGSSSGSSASASAAPSTAPTTAPAAAAPAGTTAAPAAAPAAATTAQGGVAGGVNAIFESLKAAYGNKPAATTLYQKRMLY